jgi:hypothetical protein
VTAQEESTKELLLKIFERFDLSRWTFTDRVIIDHTAKPHSHPVLTLGTKFIVRTPLGVLSTYLHEQLHWYLVDRADETRAAIEDLRKMYPAVPDAEHGGAANDHSTYLHLVVNWLELESLAAVVGREMAEETLRQAAEGPVYGWVYGEVFDKHVDIGDVVRRHGLELMQAGGNASGGRRTSETP